MKAIIIKSELLLHLAEILTWAGLYSDDCGFVVLVINSKLLAKQFTVDHVAGFSTQKIFGTLIFSNNILGMWKIGIK